MTNQCKKTPVIFTGAQHIKSNHQKLLRKFFVVFFYFLMHVIFDH